jgi:MFS family permease
MLPPTLITRWFKVNRGRALGFAHMPLLAAGISPLVALVLTHHGLTTTYIMLAALTALLLPALLFVVDYPPDAAERNEAVTAETAAGPKLNLRTLLGTGAFWMISLPFAAIVVGATIMAAHIVPMTMDWGIDPTRAATLLAVSSLGGMAGSVIFGWVADRLGPALTLVIMCINNAISWALLMLQPPYEVILLLATSMGLHTAAIAPVVSLAFSQRFGQASFGRVFGMSNLVNLPFMMIGVPTAGHVYVRTGSYMGAVVGLVAFTIIGALCAFRARTLQTAKS